MSTSFASLDTETHCQLDLHTDTCVGRSNTILLGPIDRYVDVLAFAPGYGSKTFPIGTVGTVWTDPESGVQYLIVIHQAIHRGDELEHTQITPNQCRANDIQVDDCPMQFEQKSTHSIVADNLKVTIPLKLEGIISCFPARKPT